jgi:hypothetical protein
MIVATSHVLPSLTYLRLRYALESASVKVIRGCSREANPQMPLAPEFRSLHPDGPLFDIAQSSLWPRCQSDCRFWRGDCRKKKKDTVGNQEHIEFPYLIPKTFFGYVNVFPYRPQETKKIALSCSTSTAIGADATSDRSRKNA